MLPSPAESEASARRLPPELTPAQMREMLRRKQGGLAAMPKCK
jgi:hypothetical protein